MRTERDIKLRRKTEEFLRRSKRDIIIAFGIVCGFVESFTEEVDERKVRRKIEDAIRKDEELLKALARAIKRLEADADWIEIFMKTIAFKTNMTTGIYATSMVSFTYLVTKLISKANHASSWILFL